MTPQPDSVLWLWPFSFVLLLMLFGVLVSCILRRHDDEREEWRK